MSGAEDRWPGKKIWRKLILLLVLACSMVIALLVLILVYFNLAGLPQFIQEQIRVAFLNQGLEFKAGQVRLKGWRSIEASQAQIASESSGLFAFFLPRAVLEFERPLFSAGWTLTAGDGELAVNAVDPHDPSRVETLRLSDLRFSGRFQGEIVDISRLEANAGPLGLRAGISLENARALAHWFRRPEEVPGEERWRQHIFTLIQWLNQTGFDEGSFVSLTLAGDAQRVETLESMVEAVFPKVRSPLGVFEGIHLEVKIPAGISATEKTGLIELRAGSGGGGWGKGSHLELQSEVGLLFEEAFSVKSAQHLVRLLEFHTIQGSAGPMEVSVRNQRQEEGRWTSLITAGLDQLEGEWGKTRKLEVDGVWQHGDGWDVLWESEFEFRAQGMAGAGADAGSGLMTLKMKPVIFEMPLAEEGEGFWKFLQPYRLEGQAALQDVEVKGTGAESLSCGFQWEWPRLAIRQAEGNLQGGSFTAEGNVNALDPELVARVAFDFDVHGIAPLMPTNTQRWLGQFSWEHPPEVEGQLRLRWPSWDLQSLKWRRDIVPHLQIEGGFSAADCGYRGIPLEAAWSSFTLTNLLWRLPDLRVQRPEGGARLQIDWSMEDRSYFLGVSSLIDPTIARVAIQSEGVQRALDFFEFSTPPSVAGRAWGRWGDWEQTNLEVEVSAGDFLFRGEQCDAFRGEARYGQGALAFEQVSIRQGRQLVYVPSGVYWPGEGAVDLTNAVSSMDPDLVARVIGPRVRAAIKPYQFAQPPFARVTGRVPVRDLTLANVHFEVRGEDFSYRHFQAPEASGNVWWQGHVVRIEDVDASFYRGRLRFDGTFDFAPATGTAFFFRCGVRQADLNGLGRDLFRRESQLEGILNGEINITQANSSDLRSWGGYGFVAVEDGYLWEMPILGFFSPILNSFAPGLGNSRFSSASGSFVISGGTLQTDNLEMRSIPLTLLYHGSIDAERNVQARMQAEILRQTWGIGPVLNLVLFPISKAFEYEVTGKMEAPVIEPVYLPRFTFQPIRTLRRWFSN
jgi:hypothetical protein